MTDQNPYLDPRESTWKFIITIKPPERVTDEIKNALKETQEFREMVANAGYINFGEKLINKFKKQGILPQHLTSEQANNILNAAIHGYAMGLDGYKLEEAGKKAQGLIAPEKDFVKTTSDVISYLQAGDPLQAQALHTAAGAPPIEDIVVERAYSSQTSPGENQMLFGLVKNNVVTPILNKIEDRIITPIKEKYITPVLEKVGGKIGGQIKEKVGKETLKLIEKTAGKEVVNYVEKTLGKKAVKALVKTGAKAAIEGIVDTLGLATGPGAILIAIATWLIVEALDLASRLLVKLKKFVSENKEVFAALSLGILGFGAVIGSIPFIIVGGLMLGTMLAVGGIPAVTTGVGGAFAATMAFFLFINPAARIGAALLWFVIWIILGTALIFFIIQVGGYVVPYWNQVIENPPTPFELEWNISTENPYIGVGKKVTNAPENPGVVSYTITIEAKIEDLTGVQIKEYICQIIKESGNGNCSSTEPNWAVVAPELNDPNFVIQAGSSYQFEFTSNYGASPYSNSLVVDTVTICAITQSQGEQCSSSSASVCFGDCPNECYILDDSWSGSNKSDIEQAIAILTSQYSAFTQKVCAGFPNGITLHNAGANDNYWGFYSNSGGGGARVSIYQLGFSNSPDINDTVYILAHESGHALSDGMPSLWQEYQAWPGIATEVPYCFYSYGSSIDERFAEAIAYYTIYQSWRCSNFPTAYPNHFSFVDQKVFR